MNSSIKILPQSVTSAGSLRRFGLGTTVDSICRSILLKKVAALKKGRLEIWEPGASQPRVFGDLHAPQEYRAVIKILHLRAYPKIALGGTIGTGESYVERDWECDDLTALTRIFVANRELLLDLDGGIGAVFAPLQRWVHRWRSNSLEGSRKNIQAHYDLGNNFFELFLDETWMYSCGIFLTPESTLREASDEKNDRICRKLGLKANDHLLEIGTGWGGFALHAAKQFGCRVTTTTISQAQFEMATQRVKEAGLSDRIEVLLKDYRLLEGKYDKLVSIEMIEAVGLEFLPTYFKKCSSLLKPEGQMLLQAITIRDQYYDYARKSVDFIQRYIFPGSGIPSVGSISNAVASETDFVVFHHEDIGSDYAKTLKEWGKRLEQNREELPVRGYPEELYRLWQFYLSYCEGGFLEKSISCVQILMTKPECRRESLLGVLPC